MRELSSNEIDCVCGAANNTDSSPGYQLADDMIELIATTAKKNLAVNKAIRLFNYLFGSKIKYV